jgi:hypothetical protein
MSALKPGDIVFSFKKTISACGSFLLIPLGILSGHEQADGRERPAFPFLLAYLCFVELPSIKDVRLIS